MGNDFKDLKGLPPQEQPWKGKEIPTKLQEKAKPGREDIRFGIKDWFRIVFMYILDDAKKKLTPAEYSKAGDVWCTISFVFSIVALGLLITFAVGKCT